MVDRHRGAELYCSEEEPGFHLLGVEVVNNVYSSLQNSSLNQVLSRLISQGDIAAAFPNLSKLHVAAIVRILPVTTATVEHIQQHENEENKASK